MVTHSAAMVTQRCHMSLPLPIMHPCLNTLGHWKLRHTPMLFCVGQIVTLVSFGLFTLIRNSPGLFKSFGFGHLGQPAFVSLVLFQFLSAPLDEVIDRLSGDIKAAAAERLVCWPAIGSPVHFVAPASTAAASCPAAGRPVNPASPSHSRDFYGSQAQPPTSGKTYAGVELL